ncbi:mechanosensitive ion channel family protein [Maribellus sediminis]|uniref:mechanosensitive ion channel family protein n=1 Tax=Maribellus sediminis TaxID=2696285 RepID=UPI001431E45E|nr:mechanosensitive ion channel domain-containing protein [Maribellus sediminis]
MHYLYRFLLQEFRLIEGFETFAKPLAALLTFLSIALVSYLSYLLARKFMLIVVHRIANKTQTTWDDILVENHVFKGLANLVPALIFFYTANFAGPEPIGHFGKAEQITAADLADFYVNLDNFLILMSKVYLIGIAVHLFNALLNSVLGIYNTTPYAATRPIKGYIQLVKIFIYSMAVILIIASLFKKDPWDLIIGLGTMAAVLLLIFRDTILGFVASIQLSANKMVNLGDWITVPKHNADGTVIDITLNTVKVQNWDKTISTIPTYAMVSESFSNWRGMEESGGRRIKRSILIDVNTIKFCDVAMLTRFEKFDLIRDYVKEKERELKEYNKQRKLSDDDYISGRHQTNVGIFRKYLEVYLKQHPKVHQNMTFLVRQLQPGGKGLPIEIYVFSKEQEWAKYEAIQADIFDHIFAVVPEFELRVFQELSGVDFARSGMNRIPQEN